MRLPLSYSRSWNGGQNLEQPRQDVPDARHGIPNCGNVAGDKGPINHTWLVPAAPICAPFLDGPEPNNTA
jgi:hypothetical protein